MAKGIPEEQCESENVPLQNKDQIRDLLRRSCSSESKLETKKDKSMVRKKRRNIYSLPIIGIHFVAAKIKIKLNGIKNSNVIASGPLDIRKFDQSKISVQEGHFYGKAQLHARDNAEIQIGLNFRCENDVRLNAFHKGKLIIGNNVGIGAFSILNSIESISIGNDVMISSHVHIIDADHGIKKEEKVRSQPYTTAPINIGNDVWIGNSVTILKGVQIGDGAIIGAGSVVTKNIEPYTVVAGVPARKIRDRI